MPDAVGNKPTYRDIQVKLRFGDHIDLTALAELNRHFYFENGYVVVDGRLTDAEMAAFTHQRVNLQGRQANTSSTTRTGFNHLEDVVSSPEQIRKVPVLHRVEKLLGQMLLATRCTKKLSAIMLMSRPPFKLLKREKRALRLWLTSRTSASALKYATGSVRAHRLPVGMTVAEVGTTSAQKLQSERARTKMTRRNECPHS